MDKKVITLTNGLEVLLVSEPLLNKSACSLDIAIGSLDDPQKKQGLAHLLEHMSFMGTKKYPRKGEFHEYLASNQGLFNASTGLEHTNYRFEIDHAALEGALDRFSQFFISPTFNPKVIEAEKKVLNLEFSRNMTDESLKEQRIFYLTCSKNHPITQVHHGNLKTLKSITKNDLLNFLEEKYSANLMKVVLLSKFDIKSLEQMVLKYFSLIQKIEKPEAAYKTHVFDDEACSQYIKINSDEGSKKLKLCFEIPSLYKYYKSKPNWIINFLINTTRSGSLAYELKKQGLITELWSSSNTLSFTGFIFVDFKLTDKGSRNIEQIIEKFFAYINMIKKTGYSRHIFEEQKSITDSGYRFKEHGEGFNIVKDLAKNMHYYPAIDAERFNDTLSEYDESAFNSVLKSITPEKLKAIATGVGGKATEKDHHYKIGYSVTKFSKNLISSWQESTDPVFKYPDKNIFVPRNFDLVNDDNNPLPHKILDDERGFVWFVQDRDLKLPLAYMNLLVITKAVNKDSLCKLLSLFYVKMIEESLNDISDMAGDAGLSFGIDRDDRGVALFFVGYSDKILDLSKFVITALNDALNDDSFDRIKSRLMDNYKNLLNGTAYDLAQYKKHNLIHKHNIYFEEYSGLLKDITLEEVRNFAPRIFESISLEGYMYGNLSPCDIVKFSDFVYQSLNAKMLPKLQIPKDDIVISPHGRPQTYYVKSRSEDKCWSTFIEFGPRTTRLSAIIQLGYVFLEPFFFNQLRNKKHMGYVVETRTDFFENILGLSFTVLSAEYEPDLIAKEAENTWGKFIKKLSTVSKEQLDNNKMALINKIRKRNRTLEEWMSEIVLTATLKGDTQYGEKLVTEIEKLEMEELIETFQRALFSETRSSVSVCVSAQVATGSYMKDMQS